MNTPKRTQEVENRRPDAFNRIRMNFTKTIGIIISRPLAVAMAHRGMLAIQRSIPPPSICIHGRITMGEPEMSCEVPTQEVRQNLNGLQESARLRRLGSLV